MIPARGGSKRIMRKNIKEFCGVSMLSRAIYLLKTSDLFDHIFVSTEDVEIAQLAQKLEVDCQELRNEELSGDFIGIDEVMKDFCHNHKDNIPEDSTVLCLFPCTPFLERSDLSRFLELHQRHRTSLVFPVAEYPSNPDRALVSVGSNKFVFNRPENSMKRTQDLPLYYYDAGQFYIATAGVWKSSTQKSYVCDDIERWKAIDIDNEEDWELAELLYKSKVNSERAIK